MKTHTITQRTKSYDPMIQMIDHRIAKLEGTLDETGDILEFSPLISSCLEKVENSYLTDLMFCDQKGNLINCSTNKDNNKQRLANLQEFRSMLLEHTSI